MQPMFVEKVHNSQPFQDCTKVWMPASVPFSVPRGETTLNTAGADAPKNSRLEMFSMLKISTAKHFSQIKAICTTKTSFSLSSMQHKKMEEKNATSGSSMIFVRNVIYAQVVLFLGFGVFSCRCKSQDEGELGKIMLLQTCVLQVYDKPPVFFVPGSPRISKVP